MAETCSFTGTTNSVPDYTLGAPKQIAAKVVVIHKQAGAIQKETEDIRNPSWRIGAADSGAVKDYKITAGKGEVISLSPEDLRQNPVLFKLWKSASDRESIQCSGESSRHVSITASGSMAVHTPLTGTFEDPDFHGPMVLHHRDRVFASFSRILVSSFDLKLETAANGTLGMIHLVKSKVTRIDSSDGEASMVDTGEEFVLYTPPDAQHPVQNQVRVLNGALMLEGAAGPKYGLYLEILQTIENEYSYRFEETYRSYLFFKGNAAEDIWHPVGLQKDQPAPVYMECRYVSTIRYQSEDDRWLFPDYKPTTPTFSTADHLPEWSHDIHDYGNREIMPVQQPKEFEPIANEHNVEDLIPLLSLAPGAPEVVRTTAERVAAVNHFLRSTGATKVSVPLNHPFANAEVTTDDPPTVPGYLDYKWLQLWKAITGWPTKPKLCTSAGYGMACSKIKKCLGGHVVWGIKADTPPQGSNQVHILPICYRHNHKTFKGEMQVMNYFLAVRLDNFGN